MKLLETHADFLARAHAARRDRLWPDSDASARSLARLSFAPGDDRPVVADHHGHKPERFHAFITGFEAFRRDHGADKVVPIRMIAGRGSSMSATTMWREARARAMPRFLVLAAAGLLLSAGAAAAQTGNASQPRLRASIGCPQISSIPKDITLEEMEKLCNFTPASNPDTPRPAPPPVAAPPPIVQPPPAVPTPIERRFTIVEGLDIDGQDFDQLRNVTLQQCLAACRGAAQCRAFAYDKWNSFCFLKHTNPGTYRVEPKAIVAVNATARPAVDTTRPTLVQKYPGMIFYDTGYSQFRVGSYEECHSACEGDQRCEVFTYFTRDRQCKLVAKPGEPFRGQQNVISGIKRQVPNS